MSEITPQERQYPQIPPDGQFLVHRTNSEIEQGWSLAGVRKFEIDDQATEVSWQNPEDTKHRKQTAQKLVNAMTFDHLFEIDSVNKQNDYENLELDRVKNPRFEVIFAPRMTLEEYRNSKNIEPSILDHLFMEDGPERDDAIKAHHKISLDRQMEEEKYAVTSDESIAQAEVRILEARKADNKIDRIIRNYQQDNPDSNISLVDAIRTNEDLRYILGDYIYNQKLPQRMHAMPERVVDNSEKRPNHRGHQHLQKLSSREYAAILALSMLDGTYSNPGNGDPIEYKNGRAILGQHRAAAEELLR